MTMKRLLAGLVVAAAVLAVAGCGSGEKTSPPSTSSTTAGNSRPTTPAQLRIVEPTPNEVVHGTSTTVTLDLTGAKIVPQTSAALRPDEGHVHLSLDGTIVSMTFGLSEQLANLTPGSHTLQAEFVAADHAPFANRVTTAVIFTVQ